MEIILRTTGLLIFAILCFRLMGYRSMGDMEPIDFVIVLGIGETFGAALIDGRLNVIDAYIAIGTLTVLQIAFAWMSLKNKAFLKLLEGSPIMVIDNGKILKKNLRKARVNYSDIMEELRVQGLTSHLDVEAAYLEPSGRFSIIKKKEVEPITPRYLGKKASLTIIENGQVIGDKLTQAGITPQELTEILSNFNIDDISQVESAVITASGHMALTKKETGAF